MNIEELRRVIEKRNRISTETQDEWDYGIEQCREEEIRILSEDIPSTIVFLQSECTADEYSWISEIIDDLAEVTLSRELVACYKALSGKFPEECAKYNILKCVEHAENVLEWREKNG